MMLVSDAQMNTMALQEYQQFLTDNKSKVELKGADVGEFFRAYFAGLWNKSEPLKERGKPANKKRIKELIQELSKNG